MPQFQAFRFGLNPNPVTRSRKSPKFDMQTFAIQIKSPLAEEKENVFALLTKPTRHTVIGPQAASDFHFDDETTALTLWLVDEDRRHCYELSLNPLVANPQSQVPDDYIELGWDVISGEFAIGKESSDGILPLTAIDDTCEGYEPYG